MIRNTKLNFIYVHVRDESLCLKLLAQFSSHLLRFDSSYISIYRKLCFKLLAQFSSHL